MKNKIEVTVDFHEMEEIPKGYFRYVGKNGEISDTAIHPQDFDLLRPTAIGWIPEKLNVEIIDDRPSITLNKHRDGNMHLLFQCPEGYTYMFFNKDTNKYSDRIGLGNSTGVQKIKTDKSIDWLQ